MSAVHLLVVGVNKMKRVPVDKISRCTSLQSSLESVAIVRKTGHDCPASLSQSPIRIVAASALQGARHGRSASVSAIKLRRLRAFS